MKRRYYVLIECGPPFEGGEIVGAAIADRPSRAAKRMGYDDHDPVFVVPASRLPENVLDPKGLHNTAAE